MRIPNEHIAIRQATERLSELLGGLYDSASYEEQVGGLQLDAVVSAAPYTFALEWKRSGNIAQVNLGLYHLKRVIEESGCSLIPLLAVPYMGEAAREYCEELDVAWLDLSGNAGIFAPGLHIRERGHRNRFLSPGRIASAFGPRGSRVARWLLINSNKVFLQREIAFYTGLDQGYVSRVVRRMLDNGLVSRRRDGIYVCDPDLLLDSWFEEYRFNRNDILRGHIPVLSGARLARQVAGVLDDLDIQYAMTGLAAAWLYTRYASFRLLTVYLEKFPSDRLLETIEFRDEARGANTWLVTPNDMGVFDGAEFVDGARCVHPVQAYLDLKGHPERSIEAAEELRGQLLTWGEDDF